MLLHTFITSYKRLGEKKLLVPETDPTMTFAEVCEHVWDMQVEDVEYIFAFNTDAGTSSNVAPLVAQALADRTFAEEDEPHPQLCDWIEAYGCKTYRKPLTRRELMFRDPDHFRDVRIDRELMGLD